MAEDKCEFNRILSFDIFLPQRSNAIFCDN